MANPVISGNDVFSHACVSTNDLQATCKFYDAALAPLGMSNMGPFGDTVVLYAEAEQRRARHR